MVGTEPADGSSSVRRSLGTSEVAPSDWTRHLEGESDLLKRVGLVTTCAAAADLPAEPRTQPHLQGAIYISFPLYVMATKPFGGYETSIQAPGGSVQ